MFYSSKLKEFADGNFKFDENGRKFFKRVENPMRKGEISPYEQFLLFPWWFKKACTADPFPNKPWFLRVCSTSLLKTVGKGEIAHNEIVIWKLFKIGRV